MYSSLHTKPETMVDDPFGVVPLKAARKELFPAPLGPMTAITCPFGMKPDVGSTRNSNAFFFYRYELGLQIKI